MTIATTAMPRRLSRAEAARIIRAGLCHDIGTPEEERRAGRHEGTRAALHDLDHRGEYLVILDALRIDRVEALMVLQRAAHVRDTPAGRVSLSLFAAHVLGAAAGGTRGAYADGYFSALETFAPYVASLH